MLSIDGSTLEGGGQLVRVCLCLSAICSVLVRISRIRANRSSKGARPKNRQQQRSVHSGGSTRGSSSSNVGSASGGGLKESHLAALEWLASQCDAETAGTEVGSSEIVFRPRKRRRVQTSEREWTIELKNPGSVWLIWQAIFPFVVFGFQHPPNKPHLQKGPLQFVLRGGTNVGKSMSSEYVTQVFQPVCRKIGLPDVQIEVIRRGWAGSTQEVGEVKITVPSSTTSITDMKPSVLPAFQVRERGKITKIAITVIAGSESMRKMAIATTIELLSERFKETGTDIEVKVEVAVNEDSGDERRLYLLLVAHTENGWRLGRDHLGSGKKIAKDLDRRKAVDEAVESVVSQIVREIRRGGCVDEYMQDQLVVFQALADGASFVDAGKGGNGASLHTRTVRWVCEGMLGSLGVKFDGDSVCEGVGWNDVRKESYRTDGVDELLERMEAVDIDGQFA